MRSKPDVVRQFHSYRAANYNVVNGTTVQITVNKAALTAKADDKAKIYNQPNLP